MNLKNKLILFGLTFTVQIGMVAQQAPIQFYRPNNADGINTFETTKEDTVDFEGVKVRLGGDFAMQFQGLNQENTAEDLVDLGANFNLPSANLNIDVQLLDGVQMHLRTYLSSRHHYEAWIKGGHVQFDKLDFIKPGFMDQVMKRTSVRIGLDEFNYGDAHFRRSDNARAIFNPFVGNYIMDAFSTEVFGEVTVQESGFLGVLGLTNGKLNQSVVVDDDTDNQPSFYGKLGYDNTFGDDFRFRLTGSWYLNHGVTTGTWLYGGDRAGSRYYNVLHTTDGTGGNFEGRFNPRFRKVTAFQVNPFIKFKGLEFFGIYEIADGSNELAPSVNEGQFTQMAAEILYRFGKEESMYVAGRFNEVTGAMTDQATQSSSISRMNFGGGLFISKNILLKLEYVKQSYHGSWSGRLNGAQFEGIMGEAVISF